MYSDLSTVRRKVSWEFSKYSLAFVFSRIMQILFYQNWRLTLHIQNGFLPQQRLLIFSRQLFTCVNVLSGSSGFLNHKKFSIMAYVEHEHGFIKTTNITRSFIHSFISSSGSCWSLGTLSSGHVSSLPLHSPLALLLQFSQQPQRWTLRTSLSRTSLHFPDNSLPISTRLHQFWVHVCALAPI